MRGPEGANSRTVFFAQEFLYAGLPAKIRKGRRFSFSPKNISSQAANYIGVVTVKLQPEPKLPGAVPCVFLPTTLVWSTQKVLVPEEPGPTGMAATENEGFGLAAVGDQLAGVYVNL